MRGTPILLCFACRVNFDPIVDAIVEAPWSAPSPVPGVSTGTSEQDCTASSNALELYFRTSANGGDLSVVTRASTDDPWGQRQSLPFNTGANERSPRLSADDRQLFFATDRAGGPGSLDIWSAQRQSPADAWNAVPVIVATVNSTVDDKSLSPCDDGHYVIINDTTGSGDLFEGQLGAATSPVPSTDLNSADVESGAFLSLDCLDMYFASRRRNGQHDLYTSHRNSVGLPWSTPQLIDELSDPTASDEDPWVSPDGRTILFASNRGGTFDIYVATR